MTLFKRNLPVIFFISFFLNLIWENLHAGLYFGISQGLNFMPFFILPAIVDAGIIILLYWAVMAGGFELSAKKIMLILSYGMIVAIFIELAGLSLHLWNYAPAMPQIFGLGLSPLLQMAVLPLLSIFVSAKLLKKRVF